MEAKEKAKELVDKFYDLASDVDYYPEEIDHCHNLSTQIYNAKQCALIAVDEILDVLDVIDLEFRPYKLIKHYNDVKQEIEKL